MTMRWGSAVMVKRKRAESWSGGATPRAGRQPEGEAKPNQTAESPAASFGRRQYVSNGVPQRQSSRQRKQVVPKQQETRI